MEEKVWRVIYTKSRWEKKVNDLLQARGIESYCPLVRSERQWSDRKKQVDLPLFSSYVFTRILDREQTAVRQTPGVLNFVYYLGKPALVRPQEISDIQHFLKKYKDVQTVGLEELRAGRKVRIRNGALQDQDGTVIKIEGKRVLMVLEQLGSAILTKVHIDNLSLVSGH